MLSNWSISVILYGSNLELYRQSGLYQHLKYLVIWLNGAMRTRVRPKQTWIEGIKNDMIMFHVTKEDGP